MSLDTLWWTSVGQLHAQLQQACGGDERDPPDASKKQIEGQLDFVLNSLSSFRAQSDGSKKLLLNESKVSFKGKKFAIEALLRPATVKLSVLLDLDELQTHILLKRWLKDSGQEALIEGAVPGTQVAFDLDAMLQVQHAERTC